MKQWIMFKAGEDTERARDCTGCAQKNFKLSK
jgi:hypothetical protein